MLPPNDLPKDVIESVKNHVDRAVRAGFDSDEEILSFAADIAADAPGSVTASNWIASVLRESRSNQLEAMRSWPSVTDCDRLDAAFAELEMQGILAKQNYSCCQTCANAEINIEIEERIEDGQHVDGYVYYHAQDTEGAVDGDGMYLAYGGCDGPESTLRIAHIAVEVLSRHGLKVRWDEDVAKRIFVDIDWKRRMPRE